MTKSFIICLVVAILMAVSLGEVALAEPEQAAMPAAQPEQKVLVGINYFAGWWRSRPNKWYRTGHDWRLDYPERIPILGMYNDQATVDAEIQAAADYDVDFFSVLWYPVTPQTPTEPGAMHLNDGLTHLMASPYAGRIRFMVEYCNHPPFEVKTAEQWAFCCDTFLQAMKHPSYLRLNGRPVLKVHSLWAFIRQHDDDLDACKRDLELLRRKAREAGLGELIIGAGTSAAGPPGKPPGLFDFYATYMDVPQLEKRAEPYPYDILLKQAEGAWQRYGKNSPIPYMPYLPSGWDPRPWGDLRASFALPNRTQWTGALESVKQSLLAGGNLGLPDGAGGVQPAFTIYAWNEFGEGGFVAPSVGEQFMKLEAIQQVFGGD